MKNIKLGETFKLELFEVGSIDSEKLEIQLQNLSRIKPPRSSDRFIMFLQFVQKNEKQENEKNDLSFDGEFHFPFITKWKNYSIIIQDVDYLATYAQFKIEKS